MTKAFGMLRPGMADAVTIGNALCGAAAIAVVIATPWAASTVGEIATLRIVTLIVLAGVVLDVCDGAVARVRGGTPLGTYLDSLADAVTFGVAPALAVGGLMMRHATPVEAIVIAVAAFAYLTAALVRLADFDAGRSRDRFFTGMPSPLAAAAALSVGLIAVGPWATAAGLLLIAWLMVSGIRYPRVRGMGMVAEAAALVIAVAGIVGLIDVRIPAILTLLGCILVAPITVEVIARRRGHESTGDRSPVEQAEP